MRTIIFRVFLCILFAGLPLPLSAADLSQADALFERGGMDNCQGAIALYQGVLKADPDDFEANWKCARACREYAEAAKKAGVDGWKQTCALYGKEGMKYARKAIEKASDRVEGHYYFGLNAGIYSDGVSILTAISEGLKDKTRHSLEKAYELDRMFADAGPVLALGRFWAAVPWPFRDKKKALQLYREYQETPYFEAKEIGKVYLSELLLDVGGRENEQEAATLLKEVIRSGDGYYRARAERLLKKASGGEQEGDF